MLHHTLRAVLAIIALPLALGRTHALADPPVIVADKAAETRLDGTPPPYCSRRKHLGELGYLVDQAWVAYRRIERSSPLRVGWCACAKRCETIDHLAARYEAVAFEAKARSVDPEVPPDLRREYARLATQMFGMRNYTVGLFNTCIDNTRPPLSPPDAVEADGRADTPLQCGLTASRKLEIEWADWCEKYMRKFSIVADQFIDEFKVQKRVEAKLDFYTELRKVLRDGKYVWVLTYGNYVYSSSMTKADALRYLKMIKAISIPPVPAAASRNFYTWPSRLYTTEDGIDQPIDCPKD